MGLSLFFVFVFTKIFISYDKPLEWSFLLTLVLLSQDFLVSGIFILLEKRISKKILWTIYSLLCLWVASSLVVYEVIGSPITKSLLFAAGGALSDSFEKYINFKTLVPFFCVLIVSIFIPFICIKIKTSDKIGILFILLFFIGNVFSSRVNTFGLQRNAIFAFSTSFLSGYEHKQKNLHLLRQAFQSRNENALDFLKNKGKDLNVVVMVLESTAAQYLKPYGSPLDTMPTFSKLAEKSFLFESMYTVYPESIKGLFAAICSKTPPINREPEELAQYKKDCLPEYFKKQGYQTAMFHSGRYDYLGMESIVNDRGIATLKDAKDLSEGKYISFGLPDERVVVKKIEGWLQGLKKDSKFFLMYLPIAGHHPYLHPEKGPFEEKTEKEVYFNALNHADVALKELLNVLKKQKRDHNTLIIIYGDHGEAFFQHPGNYAHTMQIYEENVHIPFLIYLPNSKPHRIKNIASLLDLAPTLLDVMGISYLEDFEGSSLVKEKNLIAPFFTDYSQKLVGLRDGKYKMIYDLETDQVLLYDLTADKNETKNISERHKDNVKQYKKRLLDFIY